MGKQCPIKTSMFQFKILHFELGQFMFNNFNITLLTTALKDCDSKLKSHNHDDNL